MPLIFPVTVNAPPIVAYPLIFVSPPIPTPPLTFNAPVDAVVDAVASVIEIVPLDVNPVNVPTDVTFPCAAVANVPVILPVTDKFLIDPISLFESTTNAFDASAVPGPVVKSL